MTKEEKAAESVRVVAFRWARAYATKPIYRDTGLSQGDLQQAFLAGIAWQKKQQPTIVFNEREFVRAVKKGAKRL